MGMRQTNRWHWASTFAAVVALGTLLPACHCEEQREKGVEILAREYENALACCRKLEDPVAAAECAADMGHRRDCVDLWICEAFKSCKDGRNKGIREFFEALGEFIFRCVGLIRTADGTVLNPVPVLPVDTMSLQLSGSPSSTTCTDASSALLGYRLTGAIALGGIDARFPITMEFAATLPTQGIDEGPTQRIVCCAIRVDIAGEQLNLQRDATNPSYFFMRDGAEYLGLAMTGVASGPVEEHIEVPLVNDDCGSVAFKKSCQKILRKVRGIESIPFIFWMEIPVQRSGETITLGASTPLDTRSVFPHAPSPTADWTGDLTVDSLDIDAFYADSILVRDLTGDGIYDAHDEALFLERWSAAQA